MPRLKPFMRGLIALFSLRGTRDGARYANTAAIALLLTVAFENKVYSADPPRRPNLVIILADDKY